MKQLTIRSVSLILALLMVILMIPTAHAYTADAWAQTEINGMRDLGLIPGSLADADLRKGITRLDMCRIAVLSYEKLTGEAISVSNTAPFPDTADIAAAKAYAAGLIKGSDDGKFHPDSILTRDQFIAFVSQFLTAVDYPASSSDYADLSGFSDAGTVPAWLKPHAQLAVGLGIVKGSDNKLDWASQTSAQQALLMFYRTYFAALKGLNEPYANAASWAKPALEAMDALGLVPETVVYSSMTGSITRLDMCRIVMNTYKSIYGLTDDVLGTIDSPFTDTENIDVINAYRMGIVSGNGDGTFRPNDPITRQDFFKITWNFLIAMEFYPEDDGSVDLSKYPDSGELSSYAVEPAKVLISLGIITGDEARKLHPRDNVVCQEAIVIFHRTYDYIMNWTGDPGYDDERQQKIQQVINLALEIEADDSLWYVYGGKSPEDGGFDCSGFVSYCYNTIVGSDNVVGKKIYPGCNNIWNTLLDDVIPKSELLPGDLVFFKDSDGTIGHVGMYIGNDEFVHASNSRVGIIISELDSAYYTERYYGAKRVLY